MDKRITMGWIDWLDINTLKILSRHASGVIGAMVVFKLIGLFIEWGFKEGTLRNVLVTIDSFVLMGLFIWLIYQMGRLLWMGRVRNAPEACILVT